MKFNKKIQNYYKDKLVVITGGGSGLGLFVAMLICGFGGKVILTGRNIEKLDTAKQEILSKYNNAFVEYYQVDTSDYPQVFNLFEAIYKKYGAIDGVIVNAAQVYIKDFRLIPIEKIDSLLKTNINGAIYTAKAVLPYLNETSAYIAFTASIAGYAVVPESTIYTASKAALIDFSRILRLELAPRGVHVLTFSPGFFDTEFAKGGSGTPGMLTLELVAYKYIIAIAKQKEEVIFPFRLISLIMLWKFINFIGLGTPLSTFATRRLHEFYGNGKLHIKQNKEAIVPDSFGFRRLILMISPNKTVSDWIHDKLRIKRIFKFKNMQDPKN